MKRILLTLAAVAIGCAACTPKLYAPDPVIPPHYLLAGAAGEGAASAGCDWWRIFDDPALDTLIRYALRHNRNLAQAVSRLEVAREQLATARAAYLPQIGIGVSAGADYNAEEKIVQAYAVKPELSWEISLFGALRSATEAARAQILSSEWALRGVMLSLSAEVATAYFTLGRYERDLAIARESHRLRQESAALIDSMFRYGMSDGVALEQARSLVYTAAADISNYRRAVVETRLTLAVLSGENPRPADTCSLCGSGSLGRLPDGVPVGLPSDLLHRRPDVMEAYYTMQQAAAAVGTARSARFPSIALTGTGGVASTAVEDLVQGKPWVWSAAASLSQPLFAFGRLRRNERIARERYRQQALAYEQSILGALSEVERSLSDIETYRRQTADTERLMETDERIAQMTRALFRSGLSDYLDVIDAERSRYQSQMEYVDLAAQERISYVNLIKALGGGW